MGCAGSRELDIENIRSYYNSAFYRANWAIADNANARTHWNLGEDHEAIYDLYLAGEDLSSALLYLTYKYDPYYTDMPIPHFLEFHTIEKAEVTMLSILSAMSIATPDELMAFIAVTDAYRSALWDRPYNSEYYSTFVRFFKL